MTASGLSVILGSGIIIAGGVLAIDANTILQHPEIIKIVDMLGMVRLI